MMYSTWWIILGLQALFLPPDLPTQLQTVQFPYLDTWKVFKECGEGGMGGYSPGQCILHYSATTMCSKPLSCILQLLCWLLTFRTLRQYFRKGMGGRSDSVECLLVLYVFSSQCVLRSQCHLHEHSDTG